MEISLYLSRPRFSDLNNKPNAENGLSDSVLQPEALWGVNPHFTDEKPELRA